MTDKTKQLTASDIMRRELVVINESDYLQQALSLMIEHHVTGLPVVNASEKCVGVISAFDILNYEQDHAALNADSTENRARFFDPDTEQWETIRVGSFALEEIGVIQVKEVMEQDLVAVELDTKIEDVAHKMLHENVHRILVLGPHRRLRGIISATDFVRQFVVAD